MPAVVPLTVHGSREPKRSRGIPSHIRQCVMIMVRGLPDDPERKAVDYVRNLCAAEHDRLIMGLRVLFSWGMVVHEMEL
jgi:hypothetical protein